MPPEASSAAAAELPRARVRTMLVLWRAVLVVAGWVGRIGHWIFVDARSVTLLGGLVPGAILLAEDRGEAAVIAFAAWLLLVLSLAARTASNRVIIGDFKSATPKTKSEDGPDPPPVDLANLLIVEISRLRDLFRVVADRRAVASGFTHQRALDATLSGDDLVENLQGPLSSDAKTSVGPITIPLAPLVTVFGKLVQAPRLSGNLHVDGPVLILTAQMARRGSLSWRVQRSPEPRENTRDDANDGDDVKAMVSAMVEELALRIYTDLALGRAVRWEASQSFVQGLQRFRACQRTPKDRKVNLKEAEERFLSALAEDEDFPLVYYNLGVVYTELHGLAVDAGRTAEAETRLSAAETSFGRALEKDPSRWESYFAFAQTQFRYSRFDSVVQLCAHIVEQLRPDSGGKAKAHELWARALLGRDRPGDYQKAVKHARQASRLALTSLAKTRLVRRPTPRGEDDPESRCAELAAGCLLTFSDIYSRQMPTARERASGLRGRRRQRLVRRRAQALAALAPAAQGRAQVRYDFGKRLLQGGHLELAKKELAAAVRSEPTRPAYAAELALARARLLAGKNGDVDDAERHEIVGLCLRALQGMAGSFFPSRDPDACRIVADVYRCLSSSSDDDAETAAQLLEVAEDVEAELNRNVHGVSVSSVFLEILQK